MTRGGRPLVVIVSHFCPFPVIHGNGSRLVALLRWLKASGFRVSYILQPINADDDGGVRRLRDAVDRLEVIPSPHQSARMTPTVKRICGRVARALLPAAIVDVFRRVAAPA